MIGVAFDGTGYGTDGTIWGGEFLIADLADFLRAGHLAQVPMPGGAAAIRQPWRMAAAYLRQRPACDVGRASSVARRNADRWDPVVAMAGAGQRAADLKRGPPVRRRRRDPGRPRRDHLRGPGRDRA